MCGVVGFYAPQAPMPLHEAEHVLRQMTNRLEHRGPDDSGCWIDAQSGIALGQTRLAIVDLSPLGHQPMDSANGEWTIIFNGEIYNFHTLRQELASLGVTFKGHSDTEVLVEGFNIWGFAPPSKNASACLPSPLGTIASGNSLSSVIDWEKAPLLWLYRSNVVLCIRTQSSAPSPPL